MSISGAAGDMVVPHAPERVVEEDTLEAVVGANRPSTFRCQRRQHRPRQVEPARFKSGAIAQMSSTAIAVASPPPMQSEARPRF